MLLEAGNTLFLEKQYAQALAEYQAAIAQWDHPSIRFNIVRTLIRLERPVDASDNLVHALRYGATPLGDVLYNEALNYQQLLAQQVGELEVRCTQPGIVLTLDGKPLGSCPSTYERRLITGPHQIVGKRDGFVPQTLEVVVIAGQRKRASIALVSLAKATRVVHRWPTWIPWTVLGGGLLVTGVAGIVQANAISDMNAFDGRISRECAPFQCADGAAAIDEGLRDRAELKNRVAIGIATVGLATTATAAVMLYVNRGRTVLDQGGAARAHVDIAPGAGGGILRITAGF